LIIQLILNLLKTLLFSVFSWINLPQFPEGLTNSLNSFIDLIFDNLNLLGFFIRPATITIVIPVLIILINFDKVYKLTMWILKKIPMLNIH
jgi:hypothetical protein